MIVSPWSIFFAALSAIERESIQPELSLEWQAYISRTHKLRKAFISVKGIYYQVDDQKVTWLTPHALQQVMPQDVDYKIMLTFLVLFLVLSISNFELINLKYPHIIDPRLKALAADLYALTRYVGAKDRTNGTNDKESELRLAQLQDQVPSSEPGALMNLLVNATFVSRGPGESFAFGDNPLSVGVVSLWYVIVDRPTQSHKFISRDYILLQWVFDCINARIIPPTKDYMAKGLAHGCNNFEYIKVRQLKDISNEAMECLGIHLKNLRNFSVQKYGKTDVQLDNGIRAMLTGCNKLERLDITRT
ncbi:pescadillo [Tanacetum coccineum]